MKVRKMSKEVYQKLIDYIFQICDVVELKRYTTGYVHNPQRVMNIILRNKPKKLNISYTQECLDLLYAKFKDNPLIFHQGYCNQYENNNLSLNKEEIKDLINYNRRSVIEGSVYNYINDIEICNFFDKNEAHFISAKEDVNKIGDYKNSYYFFKLEGSLKKELQNKSSIFDWYGPYFLEDISFYKNGCCWLWSITHEEMCEICLQKNDKEEYEYLKSIGIEFVEKEFAPTPKEYLSYLE